MPHLALVKDATGNNVVIKAVLAEEASELEAEAAAYEALLPLQGKEVPTFLAKGKVAAAGGEELDAIAIEYIDGSAQGLADECKTMDTRNRIMQLFQKIWDLGVVHGDVEFRNIGRRKSGELVLYDFGFATVNATQQQKDDEEQEVTALLRRASDEDDVSVVQVCDAMSP